MGVGFPPRQGPMSVHIHSRAQRTRRQAITCTAPLSSGGTWGVKPVSTPQSSGEKAAQRTPEA